ncbi:hypothetical protein [Luteolibacter marinus]|uniref:hypothetical protein n=1 Tax=Luteolibacter marinus TaxID=2776705 RepID=UPI0018668284|nr:hypothetical protein [Luteolibacter marinus]
MTTKLAVFLVGFAAMASGQSETGGGKAPERLQLRVVALGHHRTTRWKMGEREGDAAAPLAPGEKAGKKKGGGLRPVEIKGKPFEYLPSPLYLRDEGDGGRVEMRPVSLALNAPGTESEVKPRMSLDLLTGETGADGGLLHHGYVSAALPNGASRALAVLVAAPGKVEAWKDPGVHVFDTSPVALPGGSLFVFNGTLFGIELDVPVKDAKGPLMLKPLESRVLRPGVNRSGRTQVVARLVGNGGKVKRQFYYNTLPVSPDSRSFLLVYADPKPKNPNPAGVVMFRDELGTEP